jgi:Archaeal TRASH domain
MLLLLACLTFAEPAKLTPQEALQPLQSLIGTWKASGTPDGTREEKQAGLWSEGIQAEWKFDKQDVHFAITFDKGRHFKTAELRYLPEKSQYEWTAKTPKGEMQKSVGTLTTGKQKEQILIVEREVDGVTERLTLTILHANRFLYRFETKPKASTLWTKRYQVGATKEGEPFAVMPKGNECIVSGGRGTIAVNHGGKTYYVCCSGCKDAFLDEPQKFIDLAAKKK